VVPGDRAKRLQATRLRMIEFCVEADGFAQE